MCLKQTGNEKNNKEMKEQQVNEQQIKGTYICLNQ